jgi:hypothetical protein
VALGLGWAHLGGAPTRGTTPTERSALKVTRVVVDMLAAAEQLAAPATVTKRT